MDEVLGNVFFNKIFCHDRGFGSICVNIQLSKVANPYKFLKIVFDHQTFFVRDDVNTLRLPFKGYKYIIL